MLHKAFICSVLGLALAVQLRMASHGRHTMIAMMHFATLVVTTVLAGGAAVFCNWMLLRVAFRLMQPATAQRIAPPVRSELVRGTGQLTRAFASHQ
jgi:hypothetical protein